MIVWEQYPVKSIAVTDQKIISVNQTLKIHVKDILHKLKKKECKMIRIANKVVTDQNKISVNQKITSMNKNFKHIKNYMAHNLNL